MSRKIPYLQRRNHALEFRIAIPSALRSIAGRREIVKTLKTQDSRKAAPIALLFASRAKQLFAKLHDMTKHTTEESTRIDYLFEVSFNESGEVSGMKIDAEPNEQEAVNSAIETTLASNAAARQKYHVAPTPVAICTNAFSTPQITSNLTLGAAINEFLDYYAKFNKATMLGVHRKTLGMFLAVVGDKPIAKLGQDDIDDFFQLIARLPTDYKQQCKVLKVSLVELSEMEHEKTLQFETFKSGYLQTINQFLEWGEDKKKAADFPPLTTRKAKKEFTGAKDKGLEGQRGLLFPELQRIFEGAEMKSFASDAAQHHKFWLMHVALFTGARANEICQLNPQVDIVQNDGVWALWINAETPSDPHIDKSVKTEESKKVPIHSKLIELGFLQYVERVKSGGAMLLFPEFPPKNRRASPSAEKFFRDFLVLLNLRDETPTKMVTGMHTFRHTLLTRGATQPNPIILTAITGHAQKENKFGVSGAAVGYMKAALNDPLSVRQSMLNQLDYGLTFFEPMN